MKPATQLLYVEEEDLFRAAEAIVDAALIYRSEQGFKNCSDIDKIRLVDAVFNDPLITEQLFRSGDIPQLADVVQLDKL